MDYRPEPLKHTPGPWDTDINNNILIPYSNSPIGKTYGIAWMHHGNYESRDADLRLILAAPDILDAAKYFIAAHDLGEEYTSGFSRLRKAVAKATYLKGIKGGEQ